MSLFFVSSVGSRRFYMIYNITIMLQYPIVEVKDASAIVEVKDASASFRVWNNSKSKVLCATSQLLSPSGHWTQPHSYMVYYVCVIIVAASYFLLTEGQHNNDEIGRHCIVLLLRVSPECNVKKKPQYYIMSM